MSGPRATMADAKIIWDSLPEKGRSIRKGVEAIKAQGLTCAISTLGRWIDSGWTTGNMTKRGHDASKDRATRRKDAPSATISSNIANHEGKVTRLDVIMAEEAEMKAERERLLLETSDSELARTAMRESLAAQIVLARQITRRAAVLVEVDPETAAKLLHVLKAPSSSTTIVIPPNEAPPQAPNGDNARVVDGRVLVEKSPSQLAIEQFRARRGVAA